MASDGHVTAPASPATRPDRLEELFEAYHRPLLAYALRRCPSIADAEDAVAEVFIVAWRRLDAVPPGDGALPWLYGVARRTIANQRRGRSRRERLVERLRHLGAPTAAPGPEPASAQEPALEALAQLSAPDRELLRLVAWEELSHAEVAQVLGISVNAVAVRLHRARQRFESAMLKGSAGWRTWSWVKGSPSHGSRREKT